MSNFSFLEDQLIRSSLDTKTDKEIAELLERPIEEVIDRLNELTNGAASDRNREIELRREEVMKEKAAKNARKEYLQLARHKAEEREANRKKRLTLDEQRRINRDKKEQSKTYSTITRDWSQYRLVRVDHKTHIYVKIGEDPRTAIEMYKNHEALKNRKKLLKED